MNNLKLKYKIEKSRDHESGEYQLMQYADNGNGEMVWQTCGVYFNEKDAIKATEKLDHYNSV